MQNNNETLNKLNTFTFPENKTAPNELKTPNISPKTTVLNNKKYSKGYSILENKKSHNSFNDKNNTYDNNMNDYKSYDLPPLPRKKSIHSMKGNPQHHRTLSISSNPLSIDSCLSYNTNNNNTFELNDENDQTKNNFNYNNTHDNATNFTQRYNDVYFDNLDINSNKIDNSKIKHNSFISIDDFSDENTKIMKNPSSSSTDYSSDNNNYNVYNDNNTKRKSSIVYIISSPTQREVDLDVIQKL